MVPLEDPRIVESLQTTCASGLLPPTLRVDASTEEREPTVSIVPATKVPVVEDTFSRRILGWSVRDRLERDLAVMALQNAPAGRGPCPGLVHHTRGSQYASSESGELPENADLIFSMSRKGDCWENAMVESFFKTLKVELCSRFATREQAPPRAVRIHRRLLQHSPPR